MNVRPELHLLSKDRLALSQQFCLGTQQLCGLSVIVQSYIYICYLGAPSFRRLLPEWQLHGQWILPFLTSVPGEL